jgi:hypothetical protein
METKEIWAQIATARTQRKALMVENTELKTKKGEATKEDKKLLREKIAENNSKRKELLVQIKELYGQKASAKKNDSIE